MSRVSAVVVLGLGLAPLGCMSLLAVNPDKVDPTCEVQVMPYSGKHAQDARLTAALEDLEGRSSGAICQVFERLAIGGPDGWMPVVQVVDLIHEGEVHPAKDLWATTRGMSDQVVVSLHSEYILSGWLDLDQVLVHEMTHAVMRSRSIPWAGPVDSWMVEGLAMWAAGQQEKKVAATLDFDADWRTPEQSMGGLLGPGGIERYPLMVLAVDCLENQHGVQGVQRLAQAAAYGQDTQQTLEQLTGQPYAEAVEQLQVCALTGIEGHKPEGWQSYERLVDATQPEQVLSHTEAFLAEHPGSRLAPHVHYRRAKALAELDRPEQAVQAWRAQLDTPTPMDDDALLLMASQLVKLERYDEAEAALQRLLAEYPSSGDRQEASTGLASIHERTEQALDD